jgi:hypothetical protein
LRDAPNIDPDFLQRRGGTPIAFRLGLALRGIVAAAIFWAISAGVAGRSRILSGAEKSMSNRNFAGAAISTPARRRRGSWSA